MGPGDLFVSFDHFCVLGYVAVPIHHGDTAILEALEEELFAELVDGLPAQLFQNISASSWATITRLDKLRSHSALVDVLRAIGE